ncbi:MAG: type IX secretion system membrane protein PorP/SprF [Bacteroidia bacterium]|nr:type IX secretion system membrane protein PorP/SprF [Bacteroidia bacterium]
MKKIIVSLLVACLMFMQTETNAQQDVMVSQYMFNGLLLNPAYSGSHPYFSSTLLHRSQWVKFDGAPMTQILAVDGPIKNKNMGVGLIVLHDQVGATDQTDIYANYSYHLKLGKGKLSFGIKAGVSRYLFNTDQLTYWDAGDAVYDQGNKLTAWLPKFGFGMYYYTDKWFGGLSVPTLLAYDKNYTFGADVNRSSFLDRHYMATGGVIIRLNDNFKMKPSTLIKYVPTAPLQADINLNFLYKDQFWLGASYRTGDAVSAIIEYQTNFRFRVGYSYDFTLSNIRRYSSGTHEIMIGYDFGKDLSKVKTPRFF